MRHITGHDRCRVLLCRRRSTITITFAPDTPAELFVFGEVALWILVHRLDASDVGCIEYREADCEVVPQLERGVDAKVGQTFPLFLAHMVAIRLVGPENGRMPVLAPNSVTGDRCARVAD